MPHLQFELTETVTEEDAESFVSWVTQLYAEVMDTGTGHVAVTIRDGATVSLGRADADEPAVVLNGDIRAGRDFEQRRKLAMTVIDELADRWGIPTENAYVVYTEHPGEDFVLREGALNSWSADEVDGKRPESQE